MIPVVRIKPGCTFIITPGGVRILAALDGLTKMLAQDILITAGSNDHELPDPHARGDAYDVGVLSMSTAQILRARDWLQGALGSRFTVLYETPVAPTDPYLQPIAYVNPKATGTHFHIQVVKGTVYPPPDAPEVLNA